MQFALLAKDVADYYNIETKTEIKNSPDGSVIAIDMLFTLSSTNEKAMVLQVQCDFGIHPEDLKSMTGNGQVTIKKDILDYFIAQTVGTVRGIMHSKTEGTSFNGIIIPPMDVTTIISSDLIIDLPKE